MNAVTDRIAKFRRQLAEECATAGRRVEDITLIAVTKFHPASVAAHAIRCGLADLGENKAQELTGKRAELAELPVGPGESALPTAPRWHFIGRLQRNKAKQVVAAADVVHSIDRVALAEAVIKAADASDRWSTDHRLPVLVQIDLDAARTTGDRDSDADRGGVHPDDALRVADLLAGCDRLELAGVMAIAPLRADPDPAFARLAEVAARVRAEHPAARAVSAGMTHDYSAALRHGATIIRVGSALFGDRPQH